MKKVWFDEAWDDYTFWQKQDKKTIKRINRLLQEIERGILMIRARFFVPFSLVIENSYYE